MGQWQRIGARCTILWVSILVALMALGCSGAGESEPDEAVAHVEQAIVTAPPLNTFVVLAKQSATIDDRSSIVGGNVGVARKPGFGFNTYSAGHDSHTSVGGELLAQRVVLADRAVAGNVNATVVSAPNATTGTRSPFVAPPDLPTPTPATAGTVPVVVNSSQTLALAPGQYAAVSVNGTLTLTGGLYEFQSLSLNNDARVIAEAASVVRIVTGIQAYDRTKLLANSNTASDLIVESSGTVTSNIGFSFGNDTTVTALLVATAGFRTGDRFIGRGAIAARDVTIGHDAELVFDSGFGCNGDSICEDGNACTLDTCVDVTCSAAPSPAPECESTILVRTDEEQELGVGPFTTFNANPTLFGQIHVPVGLVSASLTLNGGTPIEPSLDAEGNFSLPLSLPSNPARPSRVSSIDIVATDIFGRTTTLHFTIDVLSIAVPGEIVVLFSPDTTHADRMDVISTAGGSFQRELTNHIWLITATAGSTNAVMTALDAPNPKVRAAFPNAVMKPAFTPNDALIDTQTEYLQAVRAFDAWDIEQGSTDVLVATVDSGIDLPFLITGNPCPGTLGENNLYLNEAECCQGATCTTYELENCFPGASTNPNSHLAFYGDCPKEDQNGDGCPGTCNVDDDNDGLADMADPEVQRLFSNGFDDDGDGLVDEQAIVGGLSVDCANVSPGDLLNAPSNGDCDGAANDDDENGYPDDCRGWNFGRVQLPECTAAQAGNAGNGTCLVNASMRHPNEVFDLYGFGVNGAWHGSAVAQIIAQPGNDCSAYTGVAFRAKVVSLVNTRYFPPTATEAGTILPDLAATIEAYQYASQVGAHVINSSISMGPDDAFAAQFPQLNNSYGLQLVTDLLDLTGTGSALHVIAAGNSGSDITGWVQFPAAANVPNKVVIGASDPGTDAKIGSSNYSLTSVDFAAPGARLLGGFQGTSGAAPIVSGAAALLMSHSPTLRGQPEIVAELLRSSARPVAAWSGFSKTGGILDIASALGQPLPSLLYRDASSTGLPAPQSNPTTELDVFDSDFDGNVDVMVEAQCSRTNVVGQPHLRVNQSGVFTDRTTELFPQFEGSFCDVVDGDLDGDGHADLVLAAFLPDGTSAQLNNQVLMGSTSGVFALSNRLPADGLLTRAAAVCDFDSDGDLDIFFANVGGSVAVPSVLLQNDGVGNFTDISASALGGVNPPSSQSPHKVLCADLDSPPAGLCGTLPGSVCSLCADPTVSVQGLVAAGRVSSTDQAACLATRALIKPEIVVAASEGTSTVLLRSDAMGVFIDHSCDLNLPFADGTPFPGCVPGTNTPGRQDQEVEAADMDGDGDLDLVLISRRGRPNTLLFNNGSGVFTNVTGDHWTLAVDDTRSLEVADVDNDGDTDVLIARGDPNLMNPGQNTIYLNNGAGFLSEYAASGLGSKVDLTTAARFADVDFDGDQDIVIVRFGLPDRLLLNNTVP